MKINTHGRSVPLRLKAAARYELLLSKHSRARKLVDWGFVCDGGICPLNLLSSTFGEAIPKRIKQFQIIRNEEHTNSEHLNEECLITYPLNLFVADRCSLGETKEGFWYNVAPPKDPLKMRIGIRT